MVKRLRATLLIVAALASASASADEMDLSKVTCAAFAKKVAETPADHPQAYFIQILNTWLYGYAAAKSGSPMLSGTIAKQFAKDLGEECTKTPDESVLAAAENVGERSLKTQGAPK
jgi:hypothetical protein